MPVSGLINICFSSIFGIASLVEYSVPRSFVAIQSTEDRSLEFGKYALVGPRGTVRIAPDGRREIRGGLVDLGGAYGPAELALTGRPNKRFIVINSHFAILRPPQRGRPLKVRTFQSIPDRIGIFDAGGVASLKIGGTLSVHKWNRDRGTYRGLASVTLAYIK